MLVIYYFAIDFLLFFPKMAAMLIIAGQDYLFTDIVLFEYIDAKYDKTNYLYHFVSTKWILQALFGLVFWLVLVFSLLNSK